MEEPVGLPAEESYMPDSAETIDILNRAAAGFSNADHGAGIRMYWVADQAGEAHADNFADGTNAAANWASARRHPLLGKFVHLMLADRNIGHPARTGQSSTYGAFVFVRKIKEVAAVAPFDFLHGVSQTIAHELTHTITTEPTYIQATEGHVLNGDGDNDIDEEPDDMRFLMYPTLNKWNADLFWFENTTRSMIDFTTRSV